MVCEEEIIEAAKIVLDNKCNKISEVESRGQLLGVGYEPEIIELIFKKMQELEKQGYKPENCGLYKKVESNLHENFGGMNEKLEDIAFNENENGKSQENYEDMELNSNYLSEEEKSYESIETMEGRETEEPVKNKKSFFGKLKWIFNK